MCGRKDGEIRRTVGWVPVPLCFVSLSLSPNSLSDLIPPCLPSAPKALTTSLLLLSPPIPSPTPPTPSLLVFSGGTAFNCVVEELKSFTTRVAHVLPVSDDGGSTAEIFRVLDSGDQMNHFASVMAGVKSLHSYDLVLTGIGEIISSKSCPKY
ncbi:hypothetical protein DVH24_011428 [Malus domestica]|uniref:Uncharacterized protein n=1 Tax=Malus domestica TaxID=3750 RepID=A0A498JYL9_MALDO|nr:hypothetical protein DVH24_011428 [Malus domestica]